MKISTLPGRLLALVIVLMKSQGILFNNIGSVTPDDPFVFVGEILNLTCYYSATDVHHVTDVYFTRYNNERIPEKYLHRTNARNVTLRYPVTSIDDYGSYVCKVNKTGGVTSINNQQVSVEYFPVQVREIVCVVHDWSMLNCTWNLTVDYRYPEYTIVSLFWSIDNESHYRCKRQTRTSCVWWELDDLDSFKMSNIYSMSVSVRNTKRPEMHELSKSFHIDTSTKVKPAPVGSFNATPHNSTCLLLQWSHTRILRPKIYLLQYKAEWENHGFVRPITQANPEPAEINHKLCGLRPYTMYDLTISCKPEREGFESDTKRLWIRTSEDVPEAPPKVHPGGFMVTQNCDADASCRNITVYWQPIDHMKRNGIITSYRLLYRRSNDSVIVRQATVDGNVSAHSVKLQRNMDYVVEITGRTSKGPSRHSAKMYIPKSLEMPKHPGVFTVEASNVSSAVVMLKWSPVLHQNKDSCYVIFYCLKSPLDHKCTGNNIEWIPIQSNSSRFQISLSGLVSCDYYIFGIAVMRNNLSSGILWNKCIYLMNEKPRLPPPNIKVENTTKKSLRIRWNPFHCSESRAYITSYAIHYCPVNDSHECSGSQMTLHVPGSNFSHYIRGLAPKMRYKVIMQANSEAGSGIRSEPVFSIVRPQEYDFSPLLISLPTIVAVLVCIGLFLVIRKVKRAANRKLNIQLPKPDHDWSRHQNDYSRELREHLNTEFPLPQMPPSHSSSPIWQKRKGYKETNSASSTKPLETDTNYSNIENSRFDRENHHNIPEEETLLKKVALEHNKNKVDLQETLHDSGFAHLHDQDLPSTSENSMGSYSKIGTNSNGYLKINHFKISRPHGKSGVFSSNGRGSVGLSWTQSCHNVDGNLTSNRDVDNRFDNENQTSFVLEESFDSMYM